MNENLYWWLNIPLLSLPVSLAIPFPKLGGIHLFSLFIYSHFPDSTLKTVPPECSRPEVKTHSLTIMFMFLAETISYFPRENGTNGTTTVVSSKGLPKYCSKAERRGIKHALKEQELMGENNTYCLNIRIHSLWL